MVWVLSVLEAITNAMRAILAGKLMFKRSLAAIMLGMVPNIGGSGARSAIGQTMALFARRCRS